MASASPYAGFWRRAAAAGLDLLIYALFLFPTLVLLLGRDGFSAWINGATGGGVTTVLLADVLPLLLAVGFWHWRGATPGKRLLELAVIDVRGGGRVGLGQGVIRYLGYLLSALPAYLGFLWVLWDRRKQGFHDKIARTAVIYAPEDESTKSLRELMREARA